MNALQQQKCFRHGFREAVAKCPSCGHFYCRECVTEHDDRMICATCLTRQLQGTLGIRHRSRFLLRTAQFASGFLLIWMVFYFIGETLLEIPSNVHEGTLWRENWWNTP